MLETHLDRIAALAAQHCDDTEAFSHYIDIMWEREGRSDAELDTLVDAVAATIIPHIDCTVCANCCRSIAVGLTPDDIPPLANALDTPPQRLITELVDHKVGAQWGEWGIIRESPCPMLRDNLCSVYDQRPQSCREYPAFTPDFRWLKDEIMRGAGLCPIIFNVVERLKDRLGW